MFSHMGKTKAVIFNVFSINLLEITHSGGKGILLSDRLFKKFSSPIIRNDESSMLHGNFHHGKKIQPLEGLIRLNH